MVFVKAWDLGTEYCHRIFEFHKSGDFNSLFVEQLSLHMEDLEP
jgi:hypothetical protein